MKEKKLITISFAVPREFHLLDLAGAAHIFYEAREYGAPIALKFFSISTNVDEIQSSSGAFFGRLESMDELNLVEGDFIFIPGIDHKLIAEPTYFKELGPFFSWLATCYQKGINLCSVCTGTFLLAETGLLEDKSCTTHWKYLQRFELRYPKVNLLKKRLFVQTDNIYSSAGVTSGIDLALFIVEQKFGTAFAASVAREVVVYMRRGEQDPQLSVFLQYRNHQDNRVHLIQEEITKRLDQKLTLAFLANLVHTTPRNVTRLFKNTTGITIGEYIDKLRVDQAIHLLQEKHKVANVAKMCGFANENNFRSLFKKHMGILPSVFVARMS